MLVALPEVDAPVTVMVYVPLGVPGFVVPPPPLELPPQDAIQSEETPRTAISPRTRMAPVERLRDPAINTNPNSPGKRAA